jgi:hypothetical protein
MPRQPKERQTMIRYLFRRVNTAFLGKPSCDVAKCGRQTIGFSELCREHTLAAMAGRRFA